MGRQNKSYDTPDGVIWHSRSVAVVSTVIAIVDKEPFVLITKRSKKMEDFPERWCLPCGYLDWDETLEEAAKREVLEETCLQLEDFKEVLLELNGKVSSDPSANRQNVSVRFVFLLYPLKELPEISPTEETEEVEWCSCDPDVLKAKDLVFNHFKVIQSAVFQIAKSYLK